MRRYPLRMKRAARRLEIGLALALGACFFPSVSLGQANGDAPKTVVRDPKAREELLGEHRLSLQWISWDRFGKASVSDVDGTLFLRGEQRSAKTGEYLTIEGAITRVEAREFEFLGSVAIQAAAVNDGAPCVRRGTLTFRRSGKRRYWRMQEMQSPCDNVVDYVDLYLRP